MTKRPIIREQRSPKGLVTVRRERADEVDPNPLKTLEPMLEVLTETAAAVVLASGKDPATWPTFLKNETADPPFWAAKLLMALHDVRRGIHDLSECDESARTTAYQAIADSLAVAFILESLRVVANETAIVARGESLKGARKGGQRKADEVHRRDVELAREYLQERQRPGVDQRKLKERIGAKQDLPKSTAHDAINRGLRFLSETRGKPDE